MTVGSFLEQAVRDLTDSGVQTARLDALIVIEDVTKQNRANLLAHPEQKLTESQIHKLNTYIIQRKHHVPLAYIRGRAAFFGRWFIVDSNTLVPRPESEAMIELLLKLGLRAPTIADIGTGSGCLGITAALEIPAAHVFLYDLSSSALRIASANAEQLQVGVHIALQDLLENDTESYDVLLANLPYVPIGYPVNKAARHEPDLALFSGDNGLDHYRRMWKQLQRRAKPQHVIIEALPEQHPELMALAQDAGYALQASEGYAQHFIAES